MNEQNALEVRVHGDTTVFVARHGPALQAYFAANRWSLTYKRAANPIVRRVEFDAAVLLRARTAFEHRLQALGIRSYSSDYDEDANQIAFVFTTASDSARAINDLLNAGMPARAVRVTVAPETRSLQTLRDNVPPLRGGMEISEDPFRCTIGPPIAMYEGPLIRRVAITNSHCTDAINAVTGFAVLQQGQFVGTEIRDAAAFSGSGCPAGQTCRRADMAVIEIAPDVWHLNTIANTGAPHSLIYPRDDQPTAPYPVTIFDQDTVVGFTPAVNLARGTTVRKQGRTTGTTSGKITQTCVNIYSTRLGLTLLCQNSVGAEASGGDSGAPVYTWVANPPYAGGNATIRGVLWGGDYNPVTLRLDRYWYSPANNMSSEAFLFDP